LSDARHCIASHSHLIAEDNKLRSGLGEGRKNLVEPQHINLERYTMENGEEAEIGEAMTRALPARRGGRSPPPPLAGSGDVCGFSTSPARRLNGGGGARYGEGVRSNGDGASCEFPQEEWYK
jgi:hypothetical protein